MRFLEELAARRRFGMNPGLDAVRAVCSALGEPQRRFRAIHVAGTNGKGAVCAMLDAALRRRGLRIGRYTSPHLVRLNERFFLDGEPVGDVVLERLSERVFGLSQHSAPDAPAPAPGTFFEALTAVAFLLYAEAAVDYAVLECGLGGRLDATNVCEPALCVITRIGLDHCDWLGDTVEQIALEKAGIVKTGVPVVLGRNRDSVVDVVRRRALAVGAPFHYAPELADEGEIPADFSLFGSFNRENAVTAIAALKVLLGGVGAPLPPALSDGLSRVVWPGRFQRVGDRIVDGAHNPPAARALVAALEREGAARSSFDLVAGFCGDKDVDEVLAILAPLARRGFAVRTNNPRSLPAEETAARMDAAGIEATACDSLRTALRATQGAEPGKGGTLICGSLFLAGEALVELDAYPWAGGRFDPSEALRATVRPG